MKWFIEAGVESRKLLNIIAILALAIALWMISMFPGQGDYEINIFSAYPLTVWLLLGVTIVCGFSSAFLDIRVGQQPNGWVGGFLLVVATNALIIALPYLRDYAFISHGDSMVHFGKALTIVETGRVGQLNFYPLTHILAAGLAMFSGLKLEIVVISMPLIFYLVYLTNTLFLALNQKGGPFAWGTMVLMATPLVFDTFITELKPTTLAVLMLPFFFAWLVRAYFGDPQWTDRLVFIVILFGLVIIHPWAVVAALVLFFSEIIAALYSSDETNRPRSLPWNSILLLGVLWLTWFSKFKSFYTVVNVLFDPQKLTDSQIAERVVTVEKVSIPIQRIIELVILNYATILVYYLPAAIVILWVLARIVKRQRQIPVVQLVLTFFVAFFVSLSISSIFIHLFTNQETRILNIATALVPALVAIWLYDPSHRDSLTHARVRRLMPVILIIAALFGATVSYRTPIIGLINPAFSYADQAGVRHLTQYMRTDGKTVYVASSGSRNLYSITGTGQNLAKQLNLKQFRHFRMPPHLGIDESGAIKGLSDPGYLMISAFDRAYTHQAWKQSGKILPDDFIRLYQHPAWNKIYTSGDMTIWRWSDLVSIMPAEKTRSDDE